jgi:YfiH family protein
MPFQSHASLRWYQFDLLADEPGLEQAIFTRQGGVSPNPWSSLNMATSVGDSRERVIENRALILAALKLQNYGVFDVWQVHGTDVLVTDYPRPLNVPHHKADSIITDRDGVALLMLFADCVPVFFYDPIHRAVGIAHAGWQGTVARVAAKTVESMGQAFGTRPEDLLAGIGPSICENHYQVGSEVIQQVVSAFGSESGLLNGYAEDKAHFNLWEANRRVLIESGVKDAHIQLSGLCTLEDPGDWYSHRGEKGKTGRFGGVLALRTG